MCNTGAQSRFKRVVFLLYWREAEIRFDDHVVVAATQGTSRAVEWPLRHTFYSAIIPRGQDDKGKAGRVEAQCHRCAKSGPAKCREKARVLPCTRQGWIEQKIMRDGRRLTVALSIGGGWTSQNVRDAYAASSASWHEAGESWEESFTSTSSEMAVSGSE